MSTLDGLDGWCSLDGGLVELLPDEDDSKGLSSVRARRSRNSWVFEGFKVA